MTTTQESPPAAIDTKLLAPFVKAVKAGAVEQAVAYASWFRCACC